MKKTEMKKTRAKRAMPDSDSTLAEFSKTPAHWTMNVSPDLKPARVAYDSPPSEPLFPRGKTNMHRMDGWTNLVTGFNDPTRDKRTLAQFNLKIDLLFQLDAEVLWRGDWLADRAVTKIPDECIRKGFTIHVEDDTDKSLAEDMETFACEMDFLGKIHEAHCYERAYGGSGILLGVDDGQTDLTTPLDLDRIKSFSWMNVLTPLELFPRVWYGDPSAPKYGLPEIYRLQRLAYVVGITDPQESIDRQYAMPLIHESRIIRFDGIRVSRRHILQRNGWGDPVLQRMQNTITDFQQSWGSAAILLADFAQAVYGVEGLAELISSADPSNATIIAQKAQAIEMGRSTARAVLIDSKETFERKATPVTGMPELLDRFAQQMAAVMEIPVCLLMGISPAGLNATGASDVRFFYDRCAAIQERKYKPSLMHMLRLAFRSKSGPTKGKEPKNWSIRFPPLWQLDDLQESERRKNVAMADQIYVQSGILLPEEVTKSRFGGDQYSPDTNVDFDERDAMQRAIDRTQGESVEEIANLQARVAQAKDLNPPEGSAGKDRVTDPTTTGVNNGEPQ